MRDLSRGRGLGAALNADIASSKAWQIGMYRVMTLLQFDWYAPRCGGIVPIDSVEFWFAVKAAMLVGFVTAYPANWPLIRIDWKERM